LRVDDSVNSTRVILQPLLASLPVTVDLNPSQFIATKPSGVSADVRVLVADPNPFAAANLDVNLFYVSPLVLMGVAPASGAIGASSVEPLLYHSAVARGDDIGSDLNIFLPVSLAQVPPCSTCNRQPQCQRWAVLSSGAPGFVSAGIATTIMENNTVLCTTRLGGLVTVTVSTFEVSE
jgi:hypothetical protein